MLLDETLLRETNRPWVLIAGMTLLGYPIADRVDEWLSRKNGNGNGK